MKYYAVTYDSQFYRIPEEKVGVVEEAMATKKPVRLEGQLVSGADIRRIEEQADTPRGATNLGSGFEAAAQIMDTNRVAIPKEQSITEIRARFSESSGEIQKREYLAACKQQHA